MVECTKQKTQHDDENQYISRSPPRELPVGARQRGFGCGIPFGVALLNHSRRRREVPDTACGSIGIPRGRFAAN